MNKNDAGFSVVGGFIEEIDWSCKGVYGDELADSNRDRHHVSHRLISDNLQIINGAVDQFQEVIPEYGSSGIHQPPIARHTARTT